jgi:hypothetical protein
MMQNRDAQVQEPGEPERNAPWRFRCLEISQLTPFLTHLLPTNTEETAYQAAGLAEPLLSVFLGCILGH